MTVSRRGFLKILGAGAAGALLTGGREAGAIEDFHGYPERYGMLTDVSRCIGCRSCEAACNRWNRLPLPERPFEDLTVLERKRRTTAKAYTVVNQYAVTAPDRPHEAPGGRSVAFRKIQCNHCNEPACVSACFVKALVKTKEGPVLWDQDLCVGCRYCMVSCPFYIPAYEYDEPFTPRIMKCTMCFDKFTTGHGAPACAEFCPTEAITFGKLKDLVHVARERLRNEPDRYVDHVYGELEVGGTSWIYISHVPFDEIDLPTNLGTTPYPQYTKSALTWIPPIVVLWPVVLGGIYAMARRRDADHEREKEESVARAIDETREATESKAEQIKAGELKRALAKADKEKQVAVREAVKRALDEAGGGAAATGEDK